MEKEDSEENIPDVTPPSFQNLDEKLSQKKEEHLQGTEEIKIQNPIEKDPPEERVKIDEQTQLPEQKMSETEVLQQTVEQIKEMNKQKHEESKEDKLLISIHSSQKKSIQCEQKVEHEDGSKRSEQSPESSEMDKEVSSPLFKSVRSQQCLLEKNAKDENNIPFEVPTEAVPEVSTFSKKRQMCLIQNISVVISPEKKTNEEEVKKQEVKHEPLDLKSLSVLTLSAPEASKQVKPPSPKGEKKLKPWEKLKKTKSNTKQQNSNQISKIVSESSPSTSEFLKAEGSQPPNKIEVSESSTKIDDISQKDSREEKVFQEKSIFAPNSEILKTSSAVEVLEEQNKPEKETEQNKINYHNSVNNHPLLRNSPFDVIPQKEEKDEIQPTLLTKQNKKKENIQKDFEKNEHPLEPSFGKKTVSILQPQEKKVEQRGEQEEQSISSGSYFEGNNGEKVAELKKKLEELQMQIKTHRNIREQLQISTPMNVKLAISVATGAIVGGLSYVLRKQRLGSVILGIATGVSTYMIHR